MIAHHPPPELIAEYAGGRLAPGAMLAIACHLEACVLCRREARLWESVGGAMLEAGPQAPPADDALARLMERLDAPEPAAPPPPRPPRYLERLGVPGALLRQPVGRRRWVTPGIWFAPLALEEGGRRTYLVHAAPGTLLAEHTHAGRELTLVLKGAFRDGSARYARGDFALTDDSVTHRPTVTEEESCLCLISADAPMRLAGRPARMIQALMGRLY